MKKKEEVAIEQEVSSSAKPQSSREPLFGTLLLIFMMIIFLGVVAGIILGGYHGWRLNKEEKTLTSIESLAVKEAPVEEEVPSKKEGQTNPSAESASEEQVLVKAKATEIKVLNGGAAKGSAGIVTELLKKEGFIKAVAGNALGNYVGTVVYFAPALEQEAQKVKVVLMKTYPTVETKPAVSNNKETSQAPLTVILVK